MADAASEPDTGADAVRGGRRAFAARCALSALTVSLGAVLAVYGTYASLRDMVTR